MRATTYRRFLAVEDHMLRASMPRTSAADPAPAAALLASRAYATVTIANVGMTRLVRPLTATIAEAAKAVR